jgi:hypothetical protein
MDHPESPDYEGGISRRQLLKRIGAGAAIAWTVPVMITLRTPALAQGSPADCLDCAPLDCTNPRTCESRCPAFCVQRIDLTCLCAAQDFTWNTPPDPPICASDADCQQFNPRDSCVNVDPNCNASGNKACAHECL